MTAAISDASTPFSAACWRMMSSWRRGRVSSWIALSRTPRATSDAGRATDGHRDRAERRAGAGGAAWPSLHPLSFVDQRGQLALELLDRAVVLDHVRRRGRPSPPGRAGAPRARRPGRAARLGALAAHLVGGDDRDVVSKTPVHAGLEQQRHLDHGDLGARRAARRARRRSARRPAGGAAPRARRAARGRRRRSRRPGRGRPSPSGATSAPQRSIRRPRSGSESSSSWTTASVEIVAAPRRSKAASASDLPAAIPPVRPIVSGGDTGAQDSVVASAVGVVEARRSRPSASSARRRSGRSASVRPRARSSAAGARLLGLGGASSRPRRQLLSLASPPQRQRPRGLARPQRRPRRASSAVGGLRLSADSSLAAFEVAASSSATDPRPSRRSSAASPALRRSAPRGRASACSGPRPA